MENNPKHLDALPHKKRFPPFYVFVLTWCILLMFLSFDFIKNGHKFFIQLNFDWKKAQTIESFDEVTIDSLSHEFLKIKNTFKNTDLFTNYHSYSLGGQKDSYFRTSSISVNDDAIIFTGVKWLNRIPDKSIKKSALKIVDLPLLQSGNKTLITLGDSQMLWRDGREFRKNLSKNDNLLLLGSEKDVYGYPHEASVYATAKDILEKVSEIETAEYYVLFFGAHNKKTPPEVLSDQVCEILEALKEKKQTKEVLLITLPPSSNPTFDAYNKNFNEILLFCSQSEDKITIVDLYNRLKNEQEYLLEDQVHLNEKGYGILNKLLLKQLK